MSRLITLTQGQSAIVDDDQYEWLSRFLWYAHEEPKNSGKFRALRNICIGEKWTVIYMHVAIAKRINLQGEIDHRNTNTLDNRIENLRSATKSQNQANRGPPKNNKTGFKGVSWDKRSSKYRAVIGVNGKLLHCGYFDHPEEAAMAYDLAATKYFGKFARTNFV